MGAVLTQDSDFSKIYHLLEQLKQNIAGAIQGKEDVVEHVLTAVLAGGHVLIEDVPGVGKTTLAQAVSASLGCSFRRIQFTADMLPSDLIGISLFNQKIQEFEFKKGPLFAQVILADEINRTSPRTQSALLEAMSEGQISVNRETYALPRPFLVLATQNPTESYGTYPLPDSQLDRFLMRIHIGYPEEHVEKEILKTRTTQRPVESLEAVVTAEQWFQLQSDVDRVQMDDALLDYMYSIIQETRNAKLLSVGVSTRGALLFHRAVRAYALVQQRSFVLPDDIKKLAVPCLAHRVSTLNQMGSGGWTPEQPADSEHIIAELLNQIPVPV